MAKFEAKFSQESQKEGMKWNYQITRSWLLYKDGKVERFGSNTTREAVAWSEVVCTELPNSRGGQKHYALLSSSVASKKCA
jgi:hypothetical protein